MGQWVAFLMVPLLATVVLHAAAAFALTPWRAKAPRAVPVIYFTTATLVATAGFARLLVFTVYTLLGNRPDAQDGIWIIPTILVCAPLSLLSAAVLWRRAAPVVGGFNAYDRLATVALLLVGLVVADLSRQTRAEKSADRAFTQDLGPAVWTVHRPRATVTQLFQDEYAVDIDVSDLRGQDLSGASDGKDTLKLKDGNLVWMHDGAESFIMETAPFFAAAKASSAVAPHQSLVSHQVIEHHDANLAVKLVVQWARFSVHPPDNVALCQRLSGTLVWRRVLPQRQQ